MADAPDTDKLVKKEREESPAHDPITARSTSSILLICSLLLTGTLAWALWDEVRGQRPWKDMQTSFVARYNRYLKRLKTRGFQSEQQVKEDPEYVRLNDEARGAEEAVKPQVGEIDRNVKHIDRQLAAISDEFQDRRGRITVLNYRIETAHGEDDKNDLRKDVQELKADKAEVELPDGGGKAERRQLNYDEIEALYNNLKTEKANLLVQRGELLKPAVDLRKQRDEFLKNNMTGVTREQVDKLLAKNENFEVDLRQINVNADQVVDRCETCHLGIREPIDIRAGDMMQTSRRNRPDPLARAFTSHPSRELLQIHDPEKFGCSSCHGGNGRATTSIVKGHGRHRFWLHPMYERENMEAGCQQCHQQDRVLQGARILTKGKDLFTERGCVGCHRYEGFDRETDALSSTRQEIKQLEEQIAGNERESRNVQERSGEVGISDEEAQGLLARSVNLRVMNSQLESRVDQLNVQSRYLMQDQKKVGPNLKDIRLKLRKEWIPVWLKDPQAFRPGTKMPTYWYLSENDKIGVPVERQAEERNAIAAFLWQSAFEGQLPQQPAGNGGRGKELFETRGCLACHSIGEGDSAMGGEFAANLQRLGEKANYEYIVRWVHNPRERTTPYCPKERRDLTEADYRNKNVAFVFDSNHSKCPNDGAELQIQNMTVMPNFRLTDQDARDIATYLMSLSGRSAYPEASFMDDPRLKDKGRELVKQYGCAGCHEIRGFEDEQRIGKELTTEGATPLERLDFALQTHNAEDGHDPLNLRPEKKDQPWYDHKGFFERKITEPSVYDQGKEKDPKDHLRMPKPFMPEEWRIALTTFLLGSKGVEGANVPTEFFYNATNQQKDIQDGWWVIKKYNCMGCHAVQVGEKTTLSDLPLYQPGAPYEKEQQPPGLMTEGARVDPNWLLRFLRDPSLSGMSEEEMASAAHSSGQGGGGASQGDARAPAGGAGTGAGAGGAQAPPMMNNSSPPSSPPGGGGQRGTPTLGRQPGEDRNGVRTYLKVRMPTFNFSPNELRTLVRFFMAVSAQQEPFIKERIAPLTDDERFVARQLFSSGSAPCLNCHLTGNAAHDLNAMSLSPAPNFLDSAQRLKPDWTRRWLLDPQRIMPGTAMPEGLFERETVEAAHTRWVLKGEFPDARVQGFKGDHAELLMRYILQLTPQEQDALGSMGRQRAAGAQQSPPPPPPVASAHDRTRTPRPLRLGPPSRNERAGRRGVRTVKRTEVSRGSPARRARVRPRVVASLGRRGAGGFSP